MRFPQAEVAVVGLGPAGRALAHRLLHHGARVVVADPAPERAWWQTYAAWQHQLPDWLDDDVVGAQAGRPVIRAPRPVQLDDRYLVLDSGRLQRSLDISAAEPLPELLDEAAMSALAPVVVDCRGSHPLPVRRRGRRWREGPTQSAYGVVLPAELAAGLLEDADSVLMDWRPHDGAASWGPRRPSFCYLVPVPGGGVLAEETSLAATPAMDRALLRHRLAVRLRRHGVAAHEMAAAPTERVHIPLLPAPRPAVPGPAQVHRFGSAGHQLNPISGYSVGSSLQQADELARALLEHRSWPSRSADPRRLALAALDRLGGDATMELFGAFSRMPSSAQRTVLDPRTSTRPVLAAMGRQWWTMAPRHRPALVAATAAGITDLRPRPADRRAGSHCRTGAP